MKKKIIAYSCTAVLMAVVWTLHVVGVFPVLHAPIGSIIALPLLFLGES